MNVLILHCECQFFAGAQKMIGYFLEEIVRDDANIAIALVDSPRLNPVIPANIRKVILPSNQNFSPLGLIRQVRALAAFHRRHPFEVIHGWTARDWELAALSGKMLGCGSLGTLHDHPRAPFITKKRQLLMKWVANYGLSRIICVSDAVREACQRAGYDSSRLTVIHNGLKSDIKAVTPEQSGRFRIGFIGAFLARKGFSDFFQILERLWECEPDSWEARIAGQAQDDPSRKLLKEIQQKYQKHPWWERIKWLGWVENPTIFFQSIDVLVVPSTEFDPFPTVILEAGAVGRPALAARVGGIGEMIQDGETGWLYDPADLSKAAKRLAELIHHVPEIVQAGAKAQQKIKNELTIRNMVAKYLAVYSNITRNV